MTLAAQAAMLKGLADGVRERGKGQRGDKTMLDAFDSGGGGRRQRRAAVGERRRNVAGDHRRGRIGRSVDALHGGVEGARGATGRTRSRSRRSRRSQRRDHSQSNGADFLRTRPWKSEDVKRTRRSERSERSIPLGDSQGFHELIGLSRSARSSACQTAQNWV